MFLTTFGKQEHTRIRSFHKGKNRPIDEAFLGIGISMQVVVHESQLETGFHAARGCGDDSPRRQLHKQ
jgi:hypothetical protein